jgi:regulator of protease activity HflC (stomatin/prohibitin superfamily)
MSSRGYTAGSSTGALESLRTRLVQRDVNSLSEVNATFAHGGPEDNEICIVITPKAAQCFSFLQQVPSGPHVLWQNFGADQGDFLVPGGHWCWPAWKSVSHLVSQQRFTFNAKPKKCPTRDAVFVDVNLSISLSVASDFERVKTFVYCLGAERLDAYLLMQVEESIRTLVFGVTHDRVNDLRSEFASELLVTLQSKLTPLGVDVQNVKVTDVALPSELQHRLEATTAFKTRITEESKNHEHHLQQLGNDHEQKMAEIGQKYSIELQQLNAEVDRYKVNLEERLCTAKSQRKVEIEKALGAREVAVTKAKGEIEVAKFDGRSRKDAIISTAMISSEKQTRDAVVEANKRVKDAAATEAMSTNVAEARTAEAMAQGEATDKTMKKQEFELKMKLNKLDAEMAAAGRFLLDQTNGGANVLQSFLSIRDTISSPTMKR